MQIPQLYAQELLPPATAFCSSFGQSNGHWAGILKNPQNKHENFLRLAQASLNSIVDTKDSWGNTKMIEHCKSIYQFVSKIIKNKNKILLWTTLDNSKFWQFLTISGKYRQFLTCWKNSGIQQSNIYVGFVRKWPSTRILQHQLLSCYLTWIQPQFWFSEHKLFQCSQLDW